MDEAGFAQSPGALRQITFVEINGWQMFQDLVADYFRHLKNDSIKDVQVKPVGIGQDGGVDIFVDFLLTDSVQTYKRKWLVQCKFYNKIVLKSHLKDIDPQSLVSEHGADGYLLVCKNDVQSGLASALERYQANSSNNRCFAYWSGNQFITQLYNMPLRPVIQRYFPRYYEYAHAQEKKVQDI